MKKIKFCLVLIVGLVANSVPSLVLAADSSTAPKLQFTSPRVGNIFPSESGELTLTISDPNGVDEGEVVLIDEMGSRLGTLSILKGVSKMKIPLPTKGFYNVTASVRLMNGLRVVQNSTAAVIGVPFSEKEGLLSRTGVWNVHGSLDLAQVAGSSWERKMWRIADYKRDAAGGIIPIPKLESLDKRFTWIGTLAWGIPLWIEGRPTSTKAVVKGAELFPPANWGQLDSVVRQFARDVIDFPPIFELWNEPEINWAGKFDPNNLVKFHAVLAGAIKSVHPDTKVIGPCFWHVDLPRLKQLIDAGLLQHLDGISLHGYVDGGTPPEKEFISNIVELKRYLRTIGKGNFPLYLTEFGWSTGYGGTGPFVHVDELTQARYISRALTLLYAQELKAAIHFALLFNSKADTAETSFESGFSFLNKSTTPKPSYAAYANASKWLVGTSNPSWLKATPTTHMVMFDKGVRKIAVAWDTAGELRAHFPQVIVAEGMMGQRIKQTESMTLSPSPIFIQFKNKLPIFFRVKPSVLAHLGDVLTLDYKKLLLPRDLRLRAAKQVYVPPSIEKGVYVVFANRGDGIDVIPITVSD